MTEKELIQVNYARALYALMQEKAIVEEVDGEQRTIFRGKIVELFKETGASQTYYSPVRAILINNGSIEILQQGNRSRVSEVLLHQPLPEKFSALDLTTSQVGATMVRELDRRLKALEAWRESLTTATGGFNIAEALRNHERRINNLEQKD